jgi:hypothetical protein
MNNKKWTARELAAQIGCDRDTVTIHANKLYGNSGQGIVRLFSQDEVQAIIGSIRDAVPLGRKIGRKAAHVVTSENTTTSENNFSTNEISANDTPVTSGATLTSGDNFSTNEILANDTPVTSKNTTTSKNNFSTNEKLTNEDILIRLANSEREAKELWKLLAEREGKRADKAEKSAQGAYEVSNWLIKGHQRLYEEAMARYGGELPYWQR